MRGVVLSAVVGLASAFLPVTAPAANGETVTSDCGTWRTVPSVRGNIGLTAVAAVASDDVWAAGQVARDGGKRSFLEHWDGTAWAEVPVPASDVWQGINGLAALAANDVWAVGFASADNRVNPFVPLVGHWDGTGWNLQPGTPPPGASSSALVSVAPDGSGGLWAVGYAIIDGKKRTLIERWDGAAWNIMRSPSPGTEANALLDVIAASPSSALAVGHRTDGFGYRTLVERWDGTRWRVVRSANPADVDNVLTAVAAAPGGERWAVGYRIDSRWEHDTFRTLVQRRQDGRWNSVPSDNGPGTVDLLDGVAFSSAQDGWAVGARYSPAEGGYRALIEHWDGVRWTLVAPDSDPTPNQRLRDVATVPGTGEAWAVGGIGVRGLIEHYQLCPPSAGSGSGPASSALSLPSSPVAEPPSEAPAPRMSTGQPQDATTDFPAKGRVRSGDPIAVQAEDMAGAAGIAQEMRTYGAAITDYDGDGWPDIAISGAEDPAHLYRNDGQGAFSEPNPSMFTDVYRLGCSWADVNLDGRPDLFCGVSADSGTDLKANELWIQQADHSFVDEAASFGVTDPFGRGRRGVFADVNRDGYPDLWIGNRNERADGLPGSNRFLINHGGARFVDAPWYGLNNDGDGSIGPAGDLTGNRYTDLVSTGGGRLRVYRNDGSAGLTDVTDSLGLSRHILEVWIEDMDGDGRNDLVGFTARRLLVMLQQQDGRFAVRFRFSGLADAVAVAAGDVNGDDAPDLYIVQGLDQGSNAPDHLLLNRGDGKGFTSMPIPQTTLGAGNTAVPLDYDGNGLEDFLVLNGWPFPIRGPLQLIAFFPEPARHPLPVPANQHSSQNPSSDSTSTHPSVPALSP